jgi:hypothetical protein
MQTHPREPVFAGYQVFVKRLVLMPKKYDSQRGHVSNQSV